MSRSARFAAVVALALAAAGAGHAEEPAKRRGVALGLTLEDPSIAATLPAPEGERSAPARLVARWNEIEREVGTFDWTRHEEAVEALRVAGREVTLALVGTHANHVPGGGPPSPSEGTSLQAWTAFVRSAVARFGARVGTYEIGDGPRAGQDPELYAFVLKNAALGARSEATERKIAIRLAQGAIPADRLEWQRALWREDVAPYVDVLPISIEGEGIAIGEAIASFRSAAAEFPPAGEIRAIVESSGSEGAPYDLASLGVRALAAGAEIAFVPAEAEAQGPARLARWADGLRARLSPQHAPAPLGALEVLDPDGGKGPNLAILARFLHAEDFSTVVVYRAVGDLSKGEQARIVLDTPDVKDPLVADPETGTEAATGAVPVPGVSRKALAVYRADRPLVLAFGRASTGIPGLEPETEDLAVEARRGLTAEEILARYREVQKRQDDDLERWTARARVEFTFRFAQTGSSVDVAIESNYFWERGGSLEWEQTDYYLNGNLVRWKEIPELPLIQPEKVVTLPLDLTLDKAYAYRLVGEAEVDRRPCYVLSFEPVESAEGRSLYRGRVFIDKETFVRRRQSIVQTNLGPPVLSNEEVDRFSPFKTPLGAEVWLIERVDGQQLWTAGGRNFVVERRLRFSSYEVNPPAETFERKRAEAYASRNQMLRDTDGGFRYLERTDDGNRVVKETVDTSQLLAAAGAYKDDSTDGVIPLAGVNWFDYRCLGKDAQCNVLFAGVVAFANLTDPSAFGKRLDLTIEGAASALKTDDKVFVGGEEQSLARIRQRTQFLQGRLGKPLGSFFKVTATGSLAFRSFHRSREGQGALDTFNTSSPIALEFVLPQDHTVVSAGLQGEFNRRGYTVTAEAGWSRRTSWEPWGLRDPLTGTFYDVDPVARTIVPTTFDPDTKSFTKWGVTAFKEWNLPSFQKIRGEVNYLDGSSLDRFSRYEFSLFGEDRLNGFAGTGVRFDRGAIARAAYVFNLFNAIRFSAQLETARTRDEAFDVEDRSFTGFGLSGNFVGPWKTVWQVSWGRAMASDIPELEGKQEFLFLVFKLF